jgi:hypothetical protein
MPAAVGRLQRDVEAPRGSCTGTLIAPDLVLTAGHCLGGLEAGMSYRFEAAWQDGRPGFRAGVAERRRPAFRGAGPLGIGSDIALLRLDRPAPREVAPPIPIAPGALAREFVLYGFAASAPHETPQARTCFRLQGWPADAPEVLGLTCAVVSGNSGAPLLRATPEGWRLVAVMAATTRGEPLRSLAVVPPDDLLRW